MSQATCIFTQSPYPYGNDTTDRHQRVFGTLAFSADPATYTTNGLPISYANAETIKSTLPSYATPLALSPPQPVCPIWADIQSIVAINKYVFDPATGLVHVYVSGTELTSNEAIPAGVHGDTVFAMLEFNLNV